MTNRNGFAVYTQVDESEKKLPSLVMSPEIWNPGFKVETSNPKTFESGEFCRVNNLLSNPDIFLAANF